MATLYVDDGYVDDGYVQTGITVNWGIKEIFVPRSEMILIQSTPVIVYQLNLNDFRKSLNDLEDAEEGMPFLDTHDHVAPISVGGVDLARVVVIINDYTVTFEDGQYAVNLVGANSNVADRVNVNQVSVRSANSAGLPDLEVLQTAAFGGFVHYKSGSGYNSTTYPVGTTGFPVDNFPDARLILAKYNLEGIQAWGDAELNAGDDISFTKFKGQNTLLSIFVINPDASTEGTEISDAEVRGNLDGGAIVRNANLNNLNYVNGEIHNCTLLDGSITLAGTQDAMFIDCRSGKPGEQTPIIVGSPTVNLMMRGYKGGIELQTFTAGDHSIDLDSGQVIIDLSTCDNCNITVRGDGKVYDQLGNHLSTGIYNTALQIYSEANFGEHLHDIWRAMELDINNQFLLKDRIWSHDLGTYVNGSAGHALRHTTYLENSVYIDTDSLINGDGSQKHPFNNLGNGLDFAEAEGIKTLAILADVTVDRNLKNFKIIGIGIPKIECNGHDLTKTEFVHLSIKGDYIGAIIAQQCRLLDGLTLNGTFQNCGLEGDYTIALGGSALIKDCASNVPGLSRPTISLNPLGAGSLSLRNWNGGMTIKDCNTPTDKVTVEINAGSLTFDSSNTDGVMVARGFGKFVDETTGADVYNETIDRELLLTLMRYQKNKSVIDGVANTLTIYEDDNVTPLTVFDLKDASGLASITSIFQRIPR